MMRILISALLFSIFLISPALFADENELKLIKIQESNMYFLVEGAKIYRAKPQIEIDSDLKESSDGDLIKKVFVQEFAEIGEFEHVCQPTDDGNALLVGELHFSLEDRIGLFADMSDFKTKTDLGKID